MSIAFLGAGKMATAIAAGLVEKNVFTAADMVACDKFPAACEAFSTATGIEATTDNRVAIAQADVVIIAIKPQDVPATLPPIQDLLAGKLIISIAAGLSTTRLSELCGHDRVIRVMPNTPAMVGMGAAVFSAGAAANEDDCALASKIFGAVGCVHQLPENLIDAVTGVSGSGPAYVFEFIQAMVDGAEAEGIPADIALDLVVQTVAGAAEMLRQKRGTPDELRTAVTSKGGTTAAGLSVLADAEFRKLIALVIRRATERSLELGRGD